MKQKMIFGKRTICSVCISVILSTFGVCLICLWPILFDCSLSIQCSPLLFQMWKDIPVDVATELYFFNWTNPEDIHNPSVKPKFEEIGPYVFHQKEEKLDLVWNDNGTVTFKQRKFWYYVTETNTRSLQDKITTLDILILSASYMTRKWSYFFRKSVFLSLSHKFNSVHTTRTAGELLFEGYHEPLIKIFSAMPFLVHPDIPDWSRFGWYYERNGSTEYDGVVNVGTGTNSILGKIYSWNYEPKTQFFEGRCGRVAGSTGQIFPRNLGKDPVEFFSTDLRRMIGMKFANETRVNNILGYKYVGGDYIFDNGTIDAKNECFCNGECVPSGMANLTATRYDVPLFTSLPHFYGADPYYLSMVDGLKPDKEKHEFSITIEPVTGIVVEANVKMQLNLLIQPVSGTQLFDDAPKIFFPVIWSNQKVKMRRRAALMLRMMLIIPVFSVSLGVGMIVISIALIFWKCVLFQKRLKTLQQMNEEENVPLQKPAA